jgi:hypothetical protein
MPRRLSNGDRALKVFFVLVAWWVPSYSVGVQPVRIA